MDVGRIGSCSSSKGGGTGGGTSCRVVARGRGICIILVCDVGSGIVVCIGNTFLLLQPYRSNATCLSWVDMPFKAIAVVRAVTEEVCLAFVFLFISYYVLSIIVVLVIRGKRNGLSFLKFRFFITRII